MSVKLNFYNNWEIKRDQTILKLLERNSTAKVIDLGCGNGEFTLKVKEAIGIHEIFGTDCYDPSIEEARNKGITVKKCDLNESLPFEDNSFDVIVSNQVIEHLIYPVKFLNEIYRILKPQGYCVISTENLASWDNIGALLFAFTPFSMNYDSGLDKIGNPFSPHKSTHDITYPVHVRIFTTKGLSDAFKILGFNIEIIRGDGHILNLISNLDKNHSRFITFKIKK